jgi:uncharacterized sulfatase
VDLYPTLVELAGLPMPKGLEGVSLSRLLKDPEADWEHPAFTFVAGPAGKAISVRTERYRYTEWEQWEESAELIDYSTDPDELSNVVDRSEYRETLLGMKRLLHAKRDSLQKAR